MILCENMADSLGTNIPWSLGSLMVLVVPTDEQHYSTHCNTTQLSRSSPYSSSVHSRSCDIRNFMFREENGLKTRKMAAFSKKTVLCYQYVE